MVVQAYGRKDTVGEWLTIEAPYNNSFVNQIKFIVPPQSRKWNPDVLCAHPDVHQRCKGVWTVAPEFEVEIVEAMRTFYDEVFINSAGINHHFKRGVDDVRAGNDNV